MAKRFTDSTKYSNLFVRSLKPDYKLLWDFLYHECDHAGIWTVDFELAKFLLGQNLNISIEEALKLFNKDEVRIIEIDKDRKWFLPGFISFQYTELKPGNRVHKSVIKRLKMYDLWDDKQGVLMGHPYPLDGAKEKAMDKEKIKNKKNQ